MATFKDAEKREWQIRLDAPTVLAIREAGDEDFLKGDPADTVGRMESDPVLLCGVIYCCCKKQCIERGLDQEAFYLGVVGDAIDAAAEALMQALLFFIRGRDRELMKARSEKQKRIIKLATAKALEKINDPDLEAKAVAQIEEKMDEAIRQLSTPQTSAISSRDS